MAGLSLTEDAVRNFLLSCGGKSTNHALVTHFKPVLSDPENKVKNREKFKEIVNTLSTVKMDDDDVKYLLLKKKYRGPSIMTSSNQSLGSLFGSSASLAEMILASSSMSPLTTPATTPAATPATTPAATPATTPAATPATTPAATPATTPATTPAATPATTPAATPATTPAATPATTQATTPAAIPATTPATLPAATPATLPAATPTTTPAATPAVTPATTDNGTNAITSKCPPSTVDSSAISQPNYRAKSEPPSVQQSPDDLHEVTINVPTQPSTDDNNIPKCKTENNLPNSKRTPFRDSNSTISSSSLASTASEEEIVDAPSAITSVKDRAKHLNKLQSESDLLKLTSRKSDKSKHEKGKDGSEHDDDSTSAVVSLTPEQKEWLITAATGDYQDISKLLSKNPQLAKERSFINTALHWAAKHGNPDVVKLLCGKPGINVDQKTGFTPLHLASMHGHDNVIELLILTYKANPNLRDHSGKKPKQYLSSSASAKCQLLIGPSCESQEKILQTRTITERPSDEFERSEAIRKSKRVAAIGNLINSSNIMKAQPIVRSSWGGSCEDLYLDRGSGYSSHSQSPSSSRETSPVMSKKELGASSLMPPPTAPIRKKKQRSKTMYSSKENVQFDFPVIPIKKNDSDNSLHHLQVPSSSFV